MNNRVFGSMALVAVLSVMIVLRPAAASEREVRVVELEDGTEIEVRVFASEGDSLLIGFACDEGQSINEEETAGDLSEGGVEVWMPDMLGAHMLPKLRSSIARIPAEEIVALIDLAHRTTGKKIYLIATGPDADLILRGAARWEDQEKSKLEESALQGAILMFPRLNAKEPEPGKEPEYVDAVGKTRLPIVVLEGQRTPNSWGLDHFTKALSAGGSQVTARIIPDIRGYFFKREDANEPEELVTSQLSGLIKASLLYFNGTRHEN